MARLLLAMVFGAVAGAVGIWWTAAPSVQSKVAVPPQPSVQYSASPVSADATAASPVANSVVTAPGIWTTDRASTTALSSDDELASQLTLLLEQFEQDPSSAIRAALELRYFSERKLVIEQLAVAAASRAPESLIALMDHVDDYRLLAAYRSKLLSTWADLDPGAAFAYLESAEVSDVPASVTAFEGFAASDPERLIALGATLPPTLQSMAVTAALEALALRDPLAAVDALDSLPAGAPWAGFGRPEHLRTIARSVARFDPSAALNLLQSLPAGDRDAVLRGVAEAHLTAASDYLIQGIVSNPASADDPVDRLQAIVNNAIGRNADTVTEVMDRLASLGITSVVDSLGDLVTNWAAYDATSAMQWALAHPQPLTEAHYQRLARSIGEADPHLARNALIQLPASVRVSWIHGAAAGIAQSDFGGAVDWLAQRLDQQAFEEAATALVDGAVGGMGEPGPDQGAAIAAFLANGPPERLARYAPRAAMAYAQQDPAAAATWVEALPFGAEQESRRVNAISNVATIWSRVDADAAAQWALALPEGAQRDGALGSFLTHVAAGTPVEERVFNAFSSTRAREVAVSGYAGKLGEIDPQLGRRLIETYITDHEIRQRTEERMKRPLTDRDSGYAILH